MVHTSRSKVFLLQTPWHRPTERSAPSRPTTRPQRPSRLQGAAIVTLLTLCVCLLLQYLLQSCSRGGGGLSFGNRTQNSRVCVFITAGPSTKLFTWGGGDMGGHVLRETSRGLCGLGCPSRTSERGGEGDCVKGGGGEEGKCERERALERLRYYSPGVAGARTTLVE
jgi:hypothetical protein